MPSSFDGDDGWLDGWKRRYDEYTNELRGKGKNRAGEKMLIGWPNDDES